MSFSISYLESEIERIKRECVRKKDNVLTSAGERRIKALEVEIAKARAWLGQNEPATIHEDKSA